MPLQRDNLYFFDYDSTQSKAHSPSLGKETEAKDVGEKRKCRLLWLTSIRDIGAQEHIGKTIASPEGDFYRMGLLEALIYKLNGSATYERIFPRQAMSRISKAECLARMQTCSQEEANCAITCPCNLFKSHLISEWIDADAFLANQVELVGILTDDTEEDWRKGRLATYAPQPMPGYDWIHPLELTYRGSETAKDLTISVPSVFRHLPLDSPMRAGAKAQFEECIYRVFVETKADCIVVDHAMFKIDHLLSQYHLHGRILNNHPAITDSAHRYPFRGATPTRDAIRMAQSLSRNIVTGATTHLVDAEFDSGPILVYGDMTTVYPSDTPQQLRFRNYFTKKLIFFLAMRQYVEQVYPLAQQSQLSLNAPSCARRVKNAFEFLAS